MKSIFDFVNLDLLLSTTAMLLYFWERSLAHHQKKKWLQKSLLVVCCVLWIFSIHESLILFGLGYLYKCEVEYCARKKDIASSNALFKYYAEEIDTLKAENEKLNDQLLSDCYYARHDGYKAGLRSGYEAGYRECFINYNEKSGPFYDSINVSKWDVWEYASYMAKEKVKELEITENEDL